MAVTAEGARRRERVLCLFDVDGTLTPARQVGRDPPFGSSGGECNSHILRPPVKSAAARPESSRGQVWDAAPDAAIWGTPAPSHDPERPLPRSARLLWAGPEPDSEKRGLLVGI